MRRKKNVHISTIQPYMVKKAEEMKREEKGKGWKIIK